MERHIRIPLHFFKSERLLSLAKFLMLLPIGLNGSVALAQANNDKGTKPATDSEIFLYRGLGSSYVCNARTAGVEFPKAVGIAAATYTQLLAARHGGKVTSAGDKKLTNKQLFAGAEFQLIMGAVEYCPKLVPEDIKEKIEEANKKLTEAEKEKKNQ